jgi:hypothetical protein
LPTAQFGFFGCNEDKLFVYLLNFDSAFGQRRALLRFTADWRRNRGIATALWILTKPLVGLAVLKKVGKESIRFGYAVTILSHIVHTVGKDRSRQLSGKLFRALNPTARSRWLMNVIARSWYPH